MFDWNVVLHSVSRTENDLHLLAWSLYKTLPMKNICALMLMVVVMVDVVCCGQESGRDIVVSKISASIKDSVFLGKHGYGYNIIVNGEVKIHQPTIPGISGSSGFASAEDARKIARLAMAKIKDNPMLPPCISLQELQCSGIIVYDYESRSGLYRVEM
jgi:hypothetical protein